MNYQKILDDYIKTLCDNDKQCRPIDKFNYDDLYKFASSIGIRYDDLIEGSFNNQSSIWVDKFSLNKCGFRRLISLNNYYVVYELLLPNGKIYVGMTQGLGQRLIEHNICNPPKEKSHSELYKDLKKHKICICKILSVYDNKNDARACERKINDELRKECYLRTAKNVDENLYYMQPRNVILNITSKFIYNKNN